VQGESLVVSVSREEDLRLTVQGESLVVSVTREEDLG